MVKRGYADFNRPNYYGNMPRNTTFPGLIKTQTSKPKKSTLSNSTKIFLVIMVVLMLAALIFLVVKGISKNPAKQEENPVQKLDAGLKISAVQELNYTDITVKVNSNENQSNLDSIVFIFYDVNGKEITRRKVSLDSLEKLNFQVTFHFANVSKIDKITVMPTFKSDSGAQLQGKVEDIYNFTATSGTENVSEEYPANGIPSCNFSFQCEDNNACTTNDCIEGNCSFTPVEGCVPCENDSQCEDNNPCTANKCTDGKCTYLPVPGCSLCYSDAECSDNNPCTQDTCFSGRCLYTAISNCTSCTSSTQCDDNNACTVDTCSDGVCSNIPLSECTSCTSTSQCNDNDPCTTDSCLNNKCVYTPISNCTKCNTLSQCNDNDSCTLDSCSTSNNLCSNIQITSCVNGDGCCPAGCTSGNDNDCVQCTTSNQATVCNDNNACTADICSNGLCSHTTIPNCCTSSSQCNDNNVCTTDSCSNNVCSHTAIPNCCTSASQCNDNNACTLDTCSKNVCSHTSVISCLSNDGCCPVGSGCNVINDNDCSASCGNNVIEGSEKCDGTFLGGATCASVLGTGYSGTLKCTSNCQYNTSLCVAPCTCPSDNNPCTTDSCVNNVCTHSVIPGCTYCTSSTQCNDSNPCTTDTCTNNVCSNTPITSCINNDGCCPVGSGCNAVNDNNCAAVCGNNIVEGLEKCDGTSLGAAIGTVNCATLFGTGYSGTLKCTSNCQYNTSLCVAPCTCPSDNNPCTTDSCVNNVCTHSVIPGCTYCTSSTQCNDSNPCTTDTCTNNACSHSPINYCANGDGCCPPSCDSTKDNDCSASCGNNLIEAPEKCDGTALGSATCASVLGVGYSGTLRCSNCQFNTSSCIAPCNCPSDNDPCTTDACVNNICTHTAITNCCTSASQCNDNNACTTDTCSPSTNLCSHSPITSCISNDGCCPLGCNSINDNNCVASCGNNVLESGEKCDGSDLGGATCSGVLGSGYTGTLKCTSNCQYNTSLCVAPCTCPSDNDPCTTDVCQNNVCNHIAISGCCTSASQCNDNNACTTDTCSNNMCSHSSITSCANNDGCCPVGAGCSSVNDNNCVASCGNNVLESGEKCDGSDLGGATCSGVLGSGYTGTLKCTSNCQYNTSLCVAPCTCPSDNNPCTTDLCVNNVCNHIAISGCCTSASQCDDNNPCTTNLCTNNYCSYTTISTCANNDGCCPSGIGCNAANDNNCVASCGNNVIEASEKCDGSDLGGATCSGVLGSGYTGTLLCSNCQFNTSLCIAPCTQTCSSLGYQCGTRIICGNSISCGSCSTGNFCNVNGSCMKSCTSETDAQFCSRYGAYCGTITGTDNCGNTRTISSCGTCTSPQTCGGGGILNVCGSTTKCTPLTCSGLGYNCGSWSDGCGNTLSCGTCSSGQTCSSSGTCVAFSGTIYYVSTGGSDSGSGSQSSPWKTLANACLKDKTSGTIIHVMPGTYTESSTCNLAAGVSIEGDSSTNTVISSSVGSSIFAITLSSSSSNTPGNQHISNLRIKSASDYSTLGAIDVENRGNVEINNVEIINFKEYGIVMHNGESASAFATGNSIHDSIITNSGAYVGVYSSGDARGSIDILSQDGIKIYNNVITVDRPNGDNGNCIDGVEGYIKNMKVYNNVLSKKHVPGKTWDFAIEIWSWLGGIEIYNNNITGSIDIVHAVKTSSSQSYSVWVHDNNIGQPALMNTEDTRGFMLEEYNGDGRGHLDDIILERNHVKNVAKGIEVNTADSGCYITNLRVSYNIFEGIGMPSTSSKGWGIASSFGGGGIASGGNVNIWNNLFKAADISPTQMWGIDLFNVNGPVSIKNNIVVGFDYAPVYNSSGTSTSSLTIQNNIFYNNGNSNAPMGISSGTISNNIVANPLFVSSTDYHLQSTSPAINKGVNVGLSSDKDSNAISGNPDIGAYEYTGTKSCTPTTCSAQGKNCGTISDLCSGTLNCGSCSGYQTCGGSGTANVCGCTSYCSGKNCGSDGCGGSCGTCSSGQTCSSSGVCITATCTVSSYTPALNTFCGSKTVTTNCNTQVTMTGTLSCSSGQTCTNNACVTTTSTYSRTFYVSSSTGSDSNSGTSESAPWQTLDKVNSQTFQAGDGILFKRGDTFRGYLYIKDSGTSGNPITFDAYGSGNKPRIWGSKDYSSSSLWTQYSGNIWRTTSAPTSAGDVANLIFNNEGGFGFKRTSLSACTSQGDWYIDPSTSQVYLYSTSNPGNYYSHIEIGGAYIGSDIEEVIKIDNSDYITIRNLDVRYSPNNGIIFMYGCNHGIVENCDVSWIGGMYVPSDFPTRMGNCIGVWEDANDITIRYNRINQCYDAGISPQGGGTYTQSNINMYYNVISNCFYSYELFARAGSTLSNVNFDSNTCVNSGSQWSQNQRPDPSNAEHVRNTESTSTSVSSCSIRNNIFSGSLVRALQLGLTSGLVMNNNLYYVDTIGMTDDYITYTTLSQWQAATGYDVNSISANPLFVSSSDFHLQSSSPAINKGVAISGLTKDFEGKSILGNPDIGAYEYTGTTTTTCTVESDSTLCSRLAKQCGSVTATDNCGNTRTVNSCGACSSGYTCSNNLCTLQSSTGTTTLQTGLIGWWKLDGNAADSSGGGHTGTNNGVSFQSTGCVYGSCASFDGASSYIQVPYYSDLDTGSDLTMAAWVYWKGGSGDENVLTKEDSYEFKVIDGTMQYATNPWEWLGDNSYISPNTWAHVVITHEGSGQQNIYINGQNVYSTTSGGDIVSNTNPLTIGRRLAGSSFFSGLIDEVMIWNRALDSSEVHDLFNSYSYQPPAPCSCPSDNDVCTTDICSSNVCNHISINNCCASSSDCSSGQVCSGNTCVTQSTTVTGAIIADHNAALAFNNIPASCIEKAKALTFQYAHRSDGNNILEGMPYLYSQNSAYKFSSLVDSLPSQTSPIQLRIMDGNPPEDPYQYPEYYWNSAEGMAATEANWASGNFDGSMWSWCSEFEVDSTGASTAAGLAQSYLDTMNSMEAGYPNIKFIYMTSYTQNSNSYLVADNQLIRNFAKNNNKILFDFEDIGKYDPSGNYYSDADRACTWCSSWCSSHPTECGSMMDITCSHAAGPVCVQRAKAFWWLMARLAGWDGVAGHGC